MFLIKINRSTLLRVIPQIYIPIESDNPLIEVLVEKHPKYEIFWYHWPRDGPRWLPFFLAEEDYEPVTIVYDANGKICCLITRSHWRYHFFVVGDGLILPPSILFEDEFHPAYAEMEYNKEIFNQKILGLRIFSYVPKSIQSNQITEKFRKGTGHKTNLFNLVLDDPIDVAEEAYNFYCKD